MGLKKIVHIYLFALLFSPLGKEAASAQVTERSIYNESSSTVPQTISIGNRGTEIFYVPTSGFAGTRDVRLLSTHAVGTTDHIWEREIPDVLRDGIGASAQDSNLHAHAYMAGVTGGYKPVITAYRSTSSNPICEWRSQLTTFMSEVNSVQVTKNGEKIIGVFYLPDQGKSEIVTISGTNCAVIQQDLVSMFGGFQTTRLSDDGTKLFIGRKNKANVIEVNNLSNNLQVSTFVAALTAFAIDKNLTKFFKGNANIVKAFNATTGSTIATFTIDSGWGAASLDVSPNGQYLAAGYVSSNNRDIRLVVWSIDNQTIIFDKQFIGGGTFSNLLNGIEFLSDNESFAFSNWGDQSGIIPHLGFFRLGQTQPYAQFSFPGSPQKMVISDDGKRLVLANKSMHSNSSGSGGDIRTFITKELDFDIVGAPRLNGPPVLIKAKIPSFSNMFAISNSQLELPPFTFSGGTLYVSRNGIKFNQLSPIGNGWSGANFSFSTQTGNTLGQKIYFQGLATSPQRKLTSDWDSITLLP